MLEKAAGYHRRAASTRLAPDEDEARVRALLLEVSEPDFLDVSERNFARHGVAHNEDVGVRV